MDRSNSKVFISYARSDRGFVERLEAALGREGIEYWSDQNIRAGASWMEEIESAMQESSVFLLIISPDFLASDWGSYELGMAVSKGARGDALVIPIIARPTRVPPTVSRFQYIDGQISPPMEVASRVRKAIEATSKSGRLTSR